MEISQQIHSLDMWKVILIRVTTFVHPMVNYDSSKWWFQICGEQPDKITSNPKTSSRLEEGQFHSGKLVLATEPNRIDWVYRILADDISVIDLREGNLGPYSQCRDVMVSIINKWFGFENCPVTTRIALGMQLIIPVQDRVDGYKYLNNLLTFEIDPENSSDFLYQINRPKPSKKMIDKLSINRLMKWTVVNQRHGIFDPATSTYVKKGSEFAVHLELDINTSPDYSGEFDCVTSHVVTEELIEYAEGIALRGEKDE